MTKRHRFALLLAVPLLLGALMWPMAREYRKRAATQELLLRLATRNITQERAEALLSQGANVNARYYDGSSPLHLALQNDTGIVRLLLDHGADVNAQTPVSRTALVIAAERGDVEKVRLLLGRDANVNLQMKHGSKTFNALSNTRDVEQRIAEQGMNAPPQYTEIMRLLRAAGAE